LQAWARVAHMASDAELKGGGEPFGGTTETRRWAWVLILILTGFLLGIASLGLTRSGDQVVLSRSVYTELLQALDREHEMQKSLPAAKADDSASNLRQVAPAVAPVLPAASQAAATAPGAVATDADNCDVPSIRLGFDARFVPKSEEIRTRLNRKKYPTFEETYFLVVNKPYDAEQNIWKTFPNMYNLKANFHFPFSNLQDPHVELVLKMLGRTPQFAVEVGSFHGHSAITQARVFDKKGFKDLPLLCIDPWTGDLGMLLYRDDWDKKLTPGEIADGRSTSYWQFMLNVKSQMEGGNIGTKHIVPLATTSIVGARFLMAVGVTPDMIYLDSAHEIDETFTELTLYWNILAPGGVIFGDDFSWESVNHDVKRIAQRKGIELKTEGVTWYIQKPLA